MSRGRDHDHFWIGFWIVVLLMQSCSASERIKQLHDHAEDLSLRVIKLEAERDKDKQKDADNGRGNAPGMAPQEGGQLPHPFKVCDWQDAAEWGGQEC
jgi:hypothetical protein